MPEQLYEEVIDAFEALFGKHPGFRRAHAKGVVCEGTFSPASAAVDFCRAPHFQGPPVPVRDRKLLRRERVSVYQSRRPTAV